MNDQTTQADADFDLSAFEVSDTAVVDIIGLDQEPLLRHGQPVRITVYGPGSAAYVRAEGRAAQASQARALAALRGKAGKQDLEEQRQQQAEKLAAVTVGIENFPIPGGALALYANPKLGYITNQVARFLEDWANFKPASAKS